MNLQTALRRLRAARYVRPELWLRTEVAGHSIGCDGTPWEIERTDSGVVIRCVCYAASWRPL